MARTITLPHFSRDTWLDMLVNVVPIVVLAVLDLLVWFTNPWGWDLLYIALAHFLTLFPLFVLAVVTYLAAERL